MVTVGVPNGMILEGLDNLSGDLTYTEDVRIALYNCGVKSVEKRALKITNTAYFEGDYTATLRYLLRLQARNETYHLLLNNCVQQSVYAMRESNSDFDRSFSTIPNNAAIGVYSLSMPKHRPNPWIYPSKTHNYQTLY